ncbi:MAG: hypothetical protein GVY28_07335, partial [Alphaproteobacteria bacterium]|nr:hypothetical protein [Alphaproteobacteria bacterium]
MTISTSFTRRPVRRDRPALRGLFAAGVALVALGLGAGLASAQQGPDTGRLVEDLRARDLPVTAETLNQALMRRALTRGSIMLGPSAGACAMLTAAELDAAIAQNRCCHILGPDALTAAVDRGYCLDALADRLGAIAPAAGPRSTGTPVDEDNFRDDDDN